MSESLGETTMIGFHTWLCMCEGVGRDSGYVMSGLLSCMIQIIPCTNCKLYGMCMIVVCHCMRILGGE